MVMRVTVRESMTIPPFWWQRLQRRAARRAAADMDYRQGTAEPHFPVPAPRKGEKVDENHCRGRDGHGQL